MKIRAVREIDRCKVDDFVSKHLYCDEPLARTVNPSDIPSQGQGMASMFVAQNLSLVAENDDGEIMGVCCNDKFPQQLPNIYCFTQNDKKFQKLFDYLQEVSSVNEVAYDAMELRVLVVDPAHRKQGVGSALVDESVIKARNSGYNWVKMYCTSEYSSKMLAKKGWTLLYTITYEDLRNVIGDLPLPDFPHTHLNLYIKATND